MTNVGKNIAFVRKMQHQNGMTFLEVLVALVILVTGILGAVALQAVAKKSSFDTMQRSLASSLAQDIIERMRGNNANNIATYQVGSPFGAVLVPLAEPTDCNDLANNCNSAELTDHDLYEWEQSLIGTRTTAPKGTETLNVGGLVDGFGCINVTGGNTVTVVISWQGRTKVADAGKSSTGVATCGGNAATTDKKRRQVVVNAFIS